MPQSLYFSVHFQGQQKSFPPRVIRHNFSVPAPGVDFFDSFVLVKAQCQEIDIPWGERNNASKNMIQLVQGDHNQLQALLKAAHDKRRIVIEQSVTLDQRYGPVPVKIGYDPNAHAITLDIASSVDQVGSFTVLLDEQERPKRIEYANTRDKYCYYPLLETLGDGYWATKSHTCLDTPEELKLLRSTTTQLNAAAAAHQQLFETRGQVGRMLWPRIISELEHWQAPIRNFLFNRSRFVLAGSVVEMFPDLEGKRTTGHGKDMRFEEATGIYSEREDPEHPYVVVAERYTPKDAIFGEEPNPDPGKTLGHEWGHLFSHHFKQTLSQSQAFREAFEADQQSWNEKEHEAVAPHWLPETDEALEPRLEELCADVAYALNRADQYNGQLPDDCYETLVLHCFNRVAGLVKKTIEKELNLKLKVNLDDFKPLTVDLDPELKELPR